MSGNVIELGIRLNYDGKSIDGGVSISREHLRQFAQDAKRAGDATTASFSSASQGVRSISAQLEQAKSAVAGYFGVIGAYNAAKWVTDQSSAMVQLDARLKVATGSLADYQRAQAGAFEVANRWGAAVEQTAGAFARLNPVVAQLGGGAGTTLKMLDGLAASLRLSGASAAETSAVLTQFSQAMGSGKVGGDEFRSMMEQAEPLMRAVAAQMGMTTGELRQMSIEGKLTSAVFGNALLPAVEKLTKQAEQIPLGLGQSMQVLRNNLLRDFGAEFADGTNVIGESIRTLSDYTDEAATAVKFLATAVVELGKAGSVLAAGGATAYLVKKGQAAAASVAQIMAARAATLAAAEADVLATRNAVAATEAKLAEARAQQVAATQIALYGSQRAAVERALSAANAAHVASTAAVTAAEENLTRVMAAQTLAAGAKATAVRGLGLAMGALGGPIGVATTLLIAGGMAWTAWGEKADAALDGLDPSLDDLAARLAKANQELKFGGGESGNTAAQLDTVRNKMAAARKEFQASHEFLVANNAEYETYAKKEQMLLELQAKRVQQASGGDGVTLADKGAMAKLTENLKWREKLVQEHQAALVALDRAFSSDMAQAADGDKAALVATYQNARQAMQAEQQRALEGLSSSKDSRAEANARADAEAAAWSSAAKRISETLRQQWDQMRISTADYVAGTTLVEQNAILHEIEAVQLKLATATKESEKIPLREKLAELNAALDGLPGKAQAALADADAQSAKAMAKLREASGTILTPLERAAAKFETQFGETMRIAVRDGNQAGIELAQGVWGKMIDEERFADAKAQYDLLFTELKNGLEEIRQGAGNDGGLVAALNSEAAAEELKRKLLPQLQELLKVLQEASATNPISQKTVAEASGNMRQLSNQIDPIWKNTIAGIDRTFHDGFVAALERGEGAWESFTTSLRNTFKSQVADAIYQFFMREFVFKAVANVAGDAGWTGLAAAAAQAAGGSGSNNGYGAYSSAASLGTSAYQMYAGYTTGTGTGIGGAIGNWAGGYGLSGITYGSGVTVGAGGGTGAVAASEGAAGFVGPSSSLATGTAANTGGAAGTGSTSGLSSGTIAWVAAIIAGMYMSGEAWQSGNPNYRIGNYDFEDNYKGSNGVYDYKTSAQFKGLYDIDKALWGDGWADSKLRAVLTGDSLHLQMQEAIFGTGMRPTGEAYWNPTAITTGGVDSRVGAKYRSDGGWFHNDHEQTNWSPVTDTTDAVVDALFRSLVKQFKGFGFDATSGGNLANLNAAAGDNTLQLTDEMKNSPTAFFSGIGTELQRAFMEALKLDGTGNPFQLIVQGVDLVKASGEQLTATLTDMVKLKDAMDFGTVDPFEQYAKSVAAANTTIDQALANNRETVLAAAAAYDGSTASIATLYNATQARFQLEIQLAQQLDSVLKASSTQFAAGREQIALAGLDSAGKYDYYDKQAAMYKDLVATAVNPDMLKTYAEKLFSATMNGFNTMDASQQATYKAEFQAKLDQEENLINDRAAALKNQTQADNQALKDDIASAVSKAVADISAAAATPQKVDVTVHVVQQQSYSELNAGG